MELHVETFDEEIDGVESDDEEMGEVESALLSPCNQDPWKASWEEIAEVTAQNGHDPRKQMNTENSLGYACCLMAC